MASFPTYEFAGNQIVARDGDVTIASGTSFDKVAADADSYFDELRKAHDDKKKESATHIITPNGMKAKILGRTAGLWDDEITVRFENGQIRHYATSRTDGLKYVAEVPVRESRVKDLQSRLDEVCEHSKEGLLSRVNDLESIRYQAKTYIVNSKSLKEQEALHRIAMAADQEKQEVREALEYLTSVDEAIEMPKRSYVAVEQVDLGHEDSWLEVVARDMVAESEGRDYDKLLQEGPVLLVSSLDDGALNDARTVREVASSHVINKTAGFVGDEVDEYRMRFVAATEVARQKELSYRHRTQAKQASVHEASMEDATDEGLFL